MNRSIAKLISQAPADLADDLADALAALDDEANDNGNALGLFDGIDWIARQPRSFAEKVGALHRLLAIEGRVSVPDVRRFLNW